jgi:hypothetical protein
MKSILLLIVLLIFSLNLSARDDTGRFFIETGVKLAGGGDFMNFMGNTGISYNKNKMVYYFPENRTSEFSQSSFSWSLAPRIGFHLDELFSIGLDMQHFQLDAKDHMNYRNSVAGLFIRRNFTTNRIKPYIEFSSGLGSSREEYDRTSPGGLPYGMVDKRDHHYFGGATGITFLLMEKLTFSLSANIRNTIEKDSKRPDNSSNEFKNTGIEIAPRLSIGYIFKHKEEK